tara:strand:+ start:3858 stop:4556 length:699 start_codon:yes stop_codon:yes gene_type:complete
MRNGLANEWEKSYKNFDNFLFYPHEEVIRFVSKYIRKKVGFEKFINSKGYAKNSKILDIGCGIGRHMVFAHEMGLEPYGVDISNTAINFSKEWLNKKGFNTQDKHLMCGDIRKLKWEDSFFDYAISHGVLDSMSLNISIDSCKEIARVLKKDSLFYCDLISGDDSNHSKGFYGEEVVKTEHETNTIQLYFNTELIKKLFEPLFKIESCRLIKNNDVFTNHYHSRFHLILRKI